MNDFYCPMPFRHIFVSHKGLKPCCAYTSSEDITIPEWISSDKLKSIQDNFIAGRVDEGCSVCVNTEKHGFVSHRNLSLLDFYKDDPTPTDTAIDYIEFRVNNLCNFKCRSCHPGDSVAWTPDVKRFKSSTLKSYYPIPKAKLLKSAQADRDWIIDNLHRIRKLSFSGGEPTMIQEVYDIFRAVKEKKITTIDLILTTNGSFTDPFWREVALEMPNVVWNVSFDAVGAAGEIVRNGLDWPVFEDNVRFLAKNCPTVGFSSTVSNLNLFQLKPMLRFAREIRTTDNPAWNRFMYVRMVWMPAYLNPHNWPAELKDKAVTYLEETIKEETFEDVIVWLTSLRDKIQTHEFDQESWDLGQTFNSELDEIRDEDHKWLYLTPGA